MKLKHFSNLKSNTLKAINKLSLEHLNVNISIRTNGYVFFDDMHIVGYSILNKNKLEWIHSIKGYGTPFLKKIEKKISKSYKNIVLNVSIDPTEKKSAVIRRLNFYIKNGYRVYDIKYRKTMGPLFMMQKKL